MCPAIGTIPATIWKSNFSNCDDCSDRMFSAIATIPAIVTIVNDHMETRLKPGFHMIAGNHSRSLGSLVNCSAIVMIIWKPNSHFASDRQRCQRLPTIATIMIAGIESESISAIIAIVNNRQQSQKVNGNHQCSDCSDRNDCNDPSDYMETIVQRLQQS